MINTSIQQTLKKYVTDDQIGKDDKNRRVKSKSQAFI